MLNLPGELLKSGVNNVVSGGRRLVGSSTSKTPEKSTMTIMGAPNKDAITTSGFSVKSGYLFKKNEQGQFHRRFVCIVPHMFLYYYDNEMADAPRGIIDLELFSKIEIEPDQETIKLSADEEEGLRSYYLQLKNTNLISEWVASLLRDKYSIIKEERDAYRQLQDHFTGELEVTTRQAKSSSQDIERLYNDVLAAQKETEQVVRYIATALSVIGISEVEVRKLMSPEQYGRALDQYIRDFMQTNDAKRMADKEEFNDVVIGYENDIKRLDGEIEEERQARRALELRCLHERKEAETRIREYANQMEQMELNMQMSVAAKVAAESKSAQLSEQKKVLVKEVKQGRKKQEELTDTIAALKATIVAQQTQLNILQSQGGGSRDSFQGSAPNFGDENHGGITPRRSFNEGGDSDDEEDHHTTPVVSTTATAGNSAKPSPGSHNHGRKSPTPGHHVHVNQPPTPPEDNHSPSPGPSTSVSYLESMFGGATVIKNDSKPLLGDDIYRRSFDNGPNITTPVSSSAPLALHSSSVSGGSDIDSEELGEGGFPTDGKLRCFRCRGTVEGPKYSTCKCAIPALCNDDLANDPVEVGAVDKLGSFMSNLGRRASIMASSSSNSSDSPAAAAPVPTNRRSSITGMFGFGSD